MILKTNLYEKHFADKNKLESCDKRVMNFEIIHARGFWSVSDDSRARGKHAEGHIADGVHSINKHTRRKSLFLVLNRNFVSNIEPLL